MYGRVVIFIVALLASVAGQAEETLNVGAYHALVIGNNDYQRLTDLKSAHKDAVAVVQVLRERYGFKTELLLDATRIDIITALTKLRGTLGETDNLLVYYAGHGLLDEDSGVGYWLPVDAEKESPANWVSNRDITTQLKAIKSRHVMVVADSCYAGMITRNVEAGLKTGSDPDEWLRRMAQRRSRTALTSGGLEPVMDAGGGEHSVFARAFLDALRENTEVLDGQSLFDRIKRPVVANANQTPGYQTIRLADDRDGDFLFVPKGVTLPATPGAPPSNAPPAFLVDDKTMELTFWDAIEDSTEAADFEAYLTQFPNGTFAGLARIKIKKYRAKVPAPSEGEKTVAVATVSPAAGPAPRQGDNTPARAGATQRVYNVQPIESSTGRELAFLTNIVRDALATIPNGTVVSKSVTSKDYDVLVTGRISRYDKRIMANPDYQSAIMAKQIIGGFANLIPTDHMPRTIAKYEAEVTLNARNRITGTIDYETGTATIKTDPSVSENGVIASLLQKATSEAIDRLVYRLQGKVPPARPIASQEDGSFMERRSRWRE